MNNLRWLTSLFNVGRNNKRIFGKRRNNKGMLFSLLGLGVGAVTTYGMTRGRGNKMEPVPVQTMTSRFNNR
ncbi:hypothetical protein [Priestia megaterium]|jgi:hypothetical protein|uniref:hypothetical protein n=1 Tax=Priestia megaterium TaxID=1404 RepID=UPI0018689365|nr:hypothetical protein [Priestia megaterium]MBE2978829.1 hypothetical protein [Priestia megaterium]